MSNEPSPADSLAEETINRTRLVGTVLAAGSGVLLIVTLFALPSIASKLITAAQEAQQEGLIRRIEDMNGQASRLQALLSGSGNIVTELEAAQTAYGNAFADVRKEAQKLSGLSDYWLQKPHPLDSAVKAFLDAGAESEPVAPNLDDAAKTYVTNLRQHWRRGQVGRKELETLQSILQKAKTAFDSLQVQSALPSKPWMEEVGSASQSLLTVVKTATEQLPKNKLTLSEATSAMARTGEELKQSAEQFSAASRTVSVLAAGQFAPAVIVAMAMLGLACVMGLQAVRRSLRLEELRAQARASEEHNTDLRAFLEKSGLTGEKQAEHYLHHRHRAELDDGERSSRLLLAELLSQMRGLLRSEKGAARQSAKESKESA